MQNELSPEHLMDLQKSGLTPETIQASGIYSVVPSDIGKILAGRNGSAVNSLMAIPYPGCNFQRYKLFPPCKLSSKDEKPRKYYQAPGSPIFLYSPPGFDSNSPVIRISEGEKKSLKGSQEGLNVCGLGGIWNFAFKDEMGLPQLIDALVQIDWTIKEVEIIPDGDFQKNPSVCHAVFRLGSLLEKKGAKVRVVRLPDDSKLDSYLCTHSVEAFSQLELLTLDDRIFRSAAVKEEGLVLALEKCCLQARDFLKKEIPARPYILKPLLKPGSLILIYSLRGVGKTMLATSIAIAITYNVPIGKWEPESPAGVLFIDAEMSSEEYQDRLRKLTTGLPDPIAPLTILSGEWMEREGWPRINLINREWREAIYSYLKHSYHKVLILDNLAALTPGIDESSIQEWGQINDWLLSLRFLGVAVILIHHAGKSGDQRGTSGREDSLDVSLRLSRITESSDENSGCEFDATFTKARSIFGEEAMPFRFKIIPLPMGDGLTWTVETKGNVNKRMAIAMLGKGMSNKEIAGSLKVSPAYISMVKKKAIQDGFLIDEDGKKVKFTDAGEAEFGEVKIDGG
ncbi:MAG: AAA family ATPase [Pseudomonadota bacterium]